MARRVILRSRKLNTDLAKLEELTHRDWQTYWKKHIEDLKYTATVIEENAKAVVPVLTGALRDSIKCWVSRSNRWTYLIAHASAKEGSFDYALIQEENEEYSHMDPGQAHYLGQTFLWEIQALWESLDARRSKLWTGPEFEALYNYNPKERRKK